MTDIDSNPLIDRDIGKIEDNPGEDEYLSGKYCRICEAELTCEEAQLWRDICFECIDETAD